MSHLLIKTPTVRRHRKEPTVQEAIEICKGFSFVLDKLYPGHYWEVGLNQTWVHIKCGFLSGDLGYSCPLDDIKNWQSLMRIGGEILERFNVSRGRLRPEEVFTQPRDYRGNLKVS